MKKIINGKVYDTNSANNVGGWDNNRSVMDFDYCSETLYRKRTGEFFLYGEGGAMSKYSVSRGNNSWSGGEMIIPLSYEAAKKWAEKHLSGDDYESVFGKVEEDDSRTRLTVSVSASAVERAKRSASQAGLSLSAYIESLI